MTAGTRRPVFNILAWSLIAQLQGRHRKNRHGCADKRWLAPEPCPIREVWTHTEVSSHSGTVQRESVFHAVPAPRLWSFSGLAQGLTQLGARSAGPTRPTGTSWAALVEQCQCRWSPSLIFGWRVRWSTSCTRGTNASSHTTFERCKHGGLLNKGFVW